MRVAGFGRRLVHASGIVLPMLVLLELLSWSQFQVLVTVGVGIAVVLEGLRLRVGLDWWIYEQLTREYERDQVAGYAYYMVSITGVAWITDPAVAIPSMLMLMIGDPISGMLSTGGPSRIKAPRSLAAMFLVCTLLAAPFALAQQPTTEWALLTAGLGALGATVADGVTIRVRGRIIDDNLTIPPAAAFGLLLGGTVVSLVG